MPYILTYCKLTNHTFNATLRESVIQVFYVVSYEVDRLNREKEYMRLATARQ